MESPLSHDPVDSQLPPSDISEPTTPQLAHSVLTQSTSRNKAQSPQPDHALSTSMTSPPPSTQLPSNREKTRTPTPPISLISTPPPTIELPTDGRRGRIAATALLGSMTADELEVASAEDLRTQVVQLQRALQEAKMSAAHHKLQYQMLSQESAAAIERMAVEARMEQKEDAVIYHAEQARAAATPAQPSPAYEGTIPVDKGLYQRMLRDLNILAENNAALKREVGQRDVMLDRQDGEIASLSDKVTLMRERIRENREQLNRYRRQNISPLVDSTPRSIYSTPHRGHSGSMHRPQPFAALLQASEMASQESARSAHGRAVPGKKGHARNTHSMSSLPTTPQRMHKMQQPVFQTPSDRQPPLKIPSTAPVSRMSALRTPNVYNQPSLPVVPRSPLAPQSDGTVSASDHEADDSEAETDIIEPDEEVTESHASRAASQMLRSSQEQEAKRNSFKGSGMLERSSGGEKRRQTTLSGTVRKLNVDRDDERPSKRAKTGAPVIGLGIAGVRD